MTLLQFRVHYCHRKYGVRRQYIPQGTHPTPNFIDGAEAPVPVADGGGESTLDMELTYPIIFPQKIILYQTDDYDYAVEYPVEGFGNELLDALDGVCPLFPNPGEYQLISLVLLHILSIRQDWRRPSPRPDLS
jgi:hypothetical protein